MFSTDFIFRQPEMLGWIQAAMQQNTMAKFNFKGQTSLRNLKNHIPIYCVNYSRNHLIFFSLYDCTIVQLEDGQFSRKIFFLVLAI